MEFSLTKFKLSHLDELKITNDFWNVIRASPVYITIILVMSVAIDPKLKNSILAVAFLFNMLFNWIIKHWFFQPLYKLNNNKPFPILGQGSRPANAQNCGIFNKCNTKVATSFGMPSGHSQFAWTFAVYLIMNFWLDIDWDQVEEKDKTTLIVIKVLQTLFIIAVAVIISYSRVAIEKCHTTEQVILGGLIGCGLGIGTYYLVEYAQILFKKK